MKFEGNTYPKGCHSLMEQLYSGESMIDAGFYRTLLKMLITSIKAMQGHGHTDSDFLIEAKRAEEAMKKKEDENE